MLIVVPILFAFAWCFADCWCTTKDLTWALITIRQNLHLAVLVASKKQQSTHKSMYIHRKKKRSTTWTSTEKGNPRHIHKWVKNPQNKSTDWPKNKKSTLGHWRMLKIHKFGDKIHKTATLVVTVMSVSLLCPPAADRPGCCAHCFAQSAATASGPVPYSSVTHSP